MKPVPLSLSCGGGGPKPRLPSLDVSLAAWPEEKEQTVDLRGSCGDPEQAGKKEASDGNRRLPEADDGRGESKGLEVRRQPCDRQWTEMLASGLQRNGGRGGGLESGAHQHPLESSSDGTKRADGGGTRGGRGGGTEPGGPQTYELPNTIDAGPWGTPVAAAADAEGLTPSSLQPPAPLAGQRSGSHGPPRCRHGFDPDGRALTAAAAPPACRSERISPARRSAASAESAALRSRAR